MSRGLKRAGYAINFRYWRARLSGDGPRDRRRPSFHVVLVAQHESIFFFGNISCRDSRSQCGRRRNSVIPIRISRNTRVCVADDVHTHMPISTTDETPASRCPEQLTNILPDGASISGLAKAAMRTLEAGVTTVRYLGADHTGHRYADFINRGEISFPPHFCVRYGLYITNAPYKPVLDPPACGIAAGVHHGPKC